MTLKTFWSCLFLSAFWFETIISVSAIPTHSVEPVSKSSSPIPAGDAFKWRKFTSPEGNFSVLLPCSPLLRTRELIVSSGKEELRQFFCRILDETYLIQYIDRPVKRVQILGAEEILSLSDNAAVKVNHSALISKRILTLNGYPGHEITIVSQNRVRKVQRTYLVGNRLLYAYYNAADRADRNSADRLGQVSHLVYAADSETP